jgi:Intein/homing endonuclease
LNAEPHTSERMGRIVNKNRLIKNGKKLYYVDIDGKTISDNFSFLNEKRVPDSILQSGNKVFRSFLKWAFEADGNITVYNSKKDKKNMVLISYKSTNLELLRDIQIMLLRFSVQSSILFDGKLNGSSLIIKNDADVLKFYKKIGFASKKKTEKLKELVKSLESADQNEEKTFERVTEVRTLGKEDVYDIEVPKSHRFIANGIISHNTSKSSLLKYVTGIAPKARYVVGMGSSAAGLTAT